MSASNQFRLLSERRFAPFFATQFLGAFNDNVFRNALIIVITFQGITVFDLNASQLANVAGALFILPFFLFYCFADPGKRFDSVTGIKSGSIDLVFVPFPSR